MICTITEVNTYERENEVGYVVIKARGQQGDENANVLDENGFINPLACMSRVYNFTKTLFPSTQAQFKAMSENVVEGVNIRLELIRKASPKPFHIVKDLNADAVEDRYYCEEVFENAVNDTKKNLVIDGKVIKPNEVYPAKVFKPRVFNEITLTVFTKLDENGKEVCAEGDEQTLLENAWQRGVTNGVYEIVSE
jgi:hypothetical protein|nr:MAG TPA: hypothetical protein [Bacteriophage sp.]